MTRFVSAAAVLVVALAPAAVAGQGSGTVRVTAERTSVRDRAATDGSVVATVARGDRLGLIEVDGEWVRVRLPNGREGFLHILFVERLGGRVLAVSAGTDPAPAPAASSSGEPLGHRRYGAGFANVGPSVRYWIDANKGVEIDGRFSSSLGYSVTGVSASFISRFGLPSTHAPAFAPYWGAGATFWRFAAGYQDDYCRRFTNCSQTPVGVGGFLGAEVNFASAPKVAISGQVGYYTAAYGHGGLVAGLGIHFYPGAYW